MSLSEWQWIEFRTSRTFLLSLSQVVYPLLSTYWRPKNQISRRPMVFTTWSNSILPVVFGWMWNSSSASIVVTRMLIFFGILDALWGSFGWSGRRLLQTAGWAIPNRTSDTASLFCGVSLNWLTKHATIRLWWKEEHCKRLLLDDVRDVRDRTSWIESQREPNKMDALRFVKFENKNTRNVNTSGDTCWALVLVGALGR